MLVLYVSFFFFNDTATSEIYTILFVGSVRCVQETEDNVDDNDAEQLEEEIEDQIKILENNCQSYLDDNDELLFFKNVLEELMKAQAEFYYKITKILTPEEQQILLQNFEDSKQQFDEYQKHEQEEKLKRQDISQKLGIEPKAN
eukprot:TRINITY_DN5238_c0_g1_i2.p2 TRINITY_DN5238_c0_g1~~TRINITY_DN5238_c0_g1_i2.p2  ORF type:complete len:144 (-),score=50.13 TRINITY_DN5238_c0_g1_i2:28-459(-)